MIARQSIPLFGGRRLDLRQARGVILALSGADGIREWRALAASAGERCYAAVTLHDRPALYNRPRLVGRGATPDGAIEDLLWQVVTPLLLAE